MQQNLFLSLFFLLLLRDCSADQVSSSSSISSKSFSRALLHMKLRLQCLKHLLKIPHRLQQPQRPPHHPPMIALGELFFSLSSFAGRGLLYFSIPDSKVPLHWQDEYRVGDRYEPGCAWSCGWMCLGNSTWHTEDKSWRVYTHISVYFCLDKYTLDQYTFA